MSWDISQAIQTIISVALSTIFGAISGWLAGLSLQKREKKARYAVESRQEIYEPLFDEIKEMHKTLGEFRDPFSASVTLRAWANLKPSTKLRVPDDLKELIGSLDSTGGEFYDAYWKANLILKGRIDGTLDEIRSELDEREHTDSNFDILKRRVLEDYAGDFFSGRILPEKGPSHSSGSILKFRARSSLTFDIFFEQICTVIGREDQIRELRAKRERVVRITERLAEYLEQKIKFILQRYESKLTKI